MGRAKEQKHLLGGMLSLEEIKKWADTIEAQSTSNLIKFCHKPARPAHRAVIEIVFVDRVNEYQIWIFRELNIIYVDAFHEGVESDSKLFRRSLTRKKISLDEKNNAIPMRAESVGRLGEALRTMHVVDIRVGAEIRRGVTAGNHQARQILAALGVSDRERFQAQSSTKMAA